MNKFDRIKYGMDLDIKKTKIENQLERMNQSIRLQRDTCSHITVDLGYYGLFPSTGDEYCCLLCGKGKHRDYYYDPTYIVHAEDYLPQYSIRDDKQCAEKFELIQGLALGILKDDPDMSDEELVSRLNDLIEKSIAESQQTGGTKGPKLIKTRVVNK